MQVSRLGGLRACRYECTICSLTFEYFAHMKNKLYSATLNSTRGVLGFWGFGVGDEYLPLEISFGN